MSVPLVAALTYVVRAAEDNLDPVPASDQVRPGWIALALMILMAVATFLLWMNMRKQIGKIDFDEEPGAPDAAEDASPGDDDGGDEVDGADRPPAPSSNGTSSNGTGSS